MKTVITGASGFVGRLLVIELIAAGHTLLLVGRDAKKLAQVFPDVPVCEYAQLSERRTDYDLLVHLAIVNNDAGLPEQDFFATNVDFLFKVARLAKRAGSRGLLTSRRSTPWTFAIQPHTRAVNAKAQRP
jgi:nucleoside-diphosphate-sugar epimerase